MGLNWIQVAPRGDWPKKKFGGWVNPRGCIRSLSTIEPGYDVRGQLEERLSLLRTHAAHDDQKMNWILTKIGVRHSTIRKLAAGRTPKKLFKLLCREQEELADAIRYLREARSVIAVDLDFITEGLFADASEIFLRQAAKRRLILGEPNEYRDGVEEFYGALSLFCAEWPHPRTEPRLFIRRLV